MKHLKHFPNSRLLLSVSSFLLSQVIELWNERSVTWATKLQISTEKQYWVKARLRTLITLNEDITALVKAVLSSAEGGQAADLN
jgi:hypothetical protein